MSAGGPSLVESIHEREDQEIIALAHEWMATRAASKGAAPGKNITGEQDTLSRIEGQLLRSSPMSRAGIMAVLEVAHEIATARECDRDGWIGAGPAGGLIARALDGIGYLKNPDDK